MFKMPFLKFMSILVISSQGQIWDPVRRDAKTYVRRILNASHNILKTTEFSHDKSELQRNRTIQ